MSFDPKAYLANKTAKKAFDPKAYLADKSTPPVPHLQVTQHIPDFDPLEGEAAKEPTWFDKATHILGDTDPASPTGARQLGFIQGATVGTGDELGAAKDTYDEMVGNRIPQALHLKKPTIVDADPSVNPNSPIIRKSWDVSPTYRQEQPSTQEVVPEQPSLLDTYRKARDKYRAENDQASKAQPVNYGGAKIAAALPAIIGTPATPLAMGLYGGGQALANSNADLTKGNVGGAAVDTAVGAGLGALGGVAASKLANQADKIQIVAENTAANKSVEELGQRLLDTNKFERLRALANNQGIAEEMLDAHLIPASEAGAAAEAAKFGTWKNLAAPLFLGGRGAGLGALIAGKLGVDKKWGALIGAALGGGGAAAAGNAALPGKIKDILMSPYGRAAIFDALSKLSDYGTKTGLAGGLEEAPAEAATSALRERFSGNKI